MIRSVDRMTKNQLRLLCIPFFGAWAFVIRMKYTDPQRHFKTCMVPWLVSSVIVFLTGAVLGIIGLLSYAVTLIISLILLGIWENFIFFKLYNKLHDSI